ncbi:unnamed protein product [Phytomonas sp. EM1]|nr:unnamed protein product [Phytomonas sp. EM1]|eukprot:CCW62976.1 unnamed protein product [Phytomonas sp. isolate EM1]
MNDSAEATNTQVPLDEWLITNPCQFRVSTPSAAPLLPKAEHYRPKTSSSGTGRTLSSTQQEYLLELYLKLGGIYRSGLRTVLSQFLSLTLPSHIADAVDTVFEMQEQGERSSIGKAYDGNQAAAQRDSCKAVDGAHTAPDLLQPQEWLDLVQYYWLKAGCPPLQPPPLLSLEDLYRESEHNVCDEELCSPSPLSSESRHTPRVGGKRCFYDGLDSTARVEIPNEHKEHSRRESYSSRRPSCSVNNGLAVEPAGSCVSFSGVRDVVLTLFRRCGGTTPEETRDDGILDPGAERSSFLTLEAWKRAIRRYAERSSKPPPEPIIMDVTKAMMALAVLPEKGAPHHPHEHPNAREVSHDDGPHRIVTLTDFTELLRGQLCVMQRDGVGCFAVALASHPRSQSSPETPKLHASYCPLHLTRRPPTFCMLLAWMDPSSMSSIARMEGTTYLRSVGLMEAALRFLISEAQMQLAALPDAVSSPPTAKNPNSSNAILERPTTSPFSAPVRRGANTEGSGVNPSGSPSQQRVSVSRKRSEAPVSKGESAHSHKRRDLSRKRYLNPRPPDEITASIVARAHARRLLDTLRKNTVPILRYECYAMIGSGGEAETPEGKPNEPPAAGSSGKSSKQRLQKELFNLSVDLSDSDALLLAASHGGASKRAASTPLRGAVGKSKTPAMFHFSGFLASKVPKKAHHAIFERLSRPVCDLHAYDIQLPPPPSIGGQRERERKGEGGDGKKPREGKNETTAAASSIIPGFPPTTSALNRRRRGGLGSSAVSPFSPPVLQRGGRGGVRASTPRATAFSRTEGASAASIRAAYAGVAVPSAMDARETPRACVSSLPSPPTGKGARGTLAHTFFAYSLNPQPCFGHQTRGAGGRWGYPAATMPPSSGGTRGRPPPGYPQQKPVPKSGDWSAKEGA